MSSDLTVQNFAAPAVVQPPLEGAFETLVPRRSLWRRALWRRALPVVITAAVAVLLTVAVESRLRPTPAPAPVTRFSYRIPDGQEFRGWQRNVVAVSPDGRRFVLNLSGGLYLRSLDQLEARVIPGTGESVRAPFFSPDGQSVGYWQNEQLKRIGITGGTPVVICTAADTNGASWAPDGTILFGQREGIMRVPATGGTPAVVIPRQNKNALWNPQLLPDGDTVLFTEAARTLGSSSETRIVVQKISTGERKVLVEGGVDARYLATGHLVYVASDVLMGAAFDARRLAVTRGAVPVVQGMMRFHSPTIFVGNFDVAADGTLVWIYSAVSGTSDVWQLGLSDRAGKLTPLALPPGPS